LNLKIYIRKLLGHSTGYLIFLKSFKSLIARRQLA
jgi:hypothetical protein